MFRAFALLYEKQFFIYFQHIYDLIFFTSHPFPVFSLQPKGVNEFSQVAGCPCRTLTDLVAKFFYTQTSDQKSGLSSHWLQQGLVTLSHTKNLCSLTEDTASLRRPSMTAVPICLPLHLQGVTRAFKGIG